MSEKITKEYFCDRCGIKMDRSNHHASMKVSFDFPRDDAGWGTELKDLCAKCSESLQVWIKNK